MYIRCTITMYDMSGSQDNFVIISNPQCA
jgi:hypothetical protein